MIIWSDIVSALLTAGSMQHCTNSWTVVFPRLCLLSKLVLLNPSLLAWTRSNALRWYDHSGYRSYVTKLKSTSNIRFFIISPNMSYKFPSESDPDCLRQDLNTPAVTLCVSCHNRWHISSTPQPSYPEPCQQPVMQQLLSGLQRLHENNGKMALISPQILRGRQRLPGNNGIDKLDGWGWGRKQSQDVLLLWQPVPGIAGLTPSRCLILNWPLGHPHVCLGPLRRHSQYCFSKGWFTIPASGANCTPKWHNLLLLCNAS